jgi:hypothetical protein
MSTLKHAAVDSDDIKHDNAHTLINAPFNLLTYPLRSLWHSTRPYLPQLVPLAVFLISIPLLLFFSVSAGWFVWKSIAVGWEVNVDLQYGCVHLHLLKLSWH